MRLEQFEYLVATIECGNMHEAGERLHTSTQNVSKAIKGLEDELGVKLLYRSKYGVFATAEGKEVYEHALEIQKHVGVIHDAYVFDQPKYESKYIDNNIVRAICATCISGVLQKIVTSKKDQFNVALYEYEGNILKNSFFNHESLLTKNDYIFLATGRRSLSNFQTMLDKYNIYTLGISYLGVNINRNHPLAQNQTLPLKYLSQIPLVAYHDTQKATLLFSTILSENGFLHVPKPVYISNLRKLCDNFIEDNNAAIITSIPEAEDLRSHLVTEKTTLIPFKEKIEVIYIMAYPKDRTLSPNALKFKQYIFDYFKNNSKMHT